MPISARPVPTPAWARTLMQQLSHCIQFNLDYAGMCPATGSVGTRRRCVQACQALSAAWLRLCGRRSNRQAPSGNPSCICFGEPAPQGRTLCSPRLISSLSILS